MNIGIDGGHTMAELSITEQISKLKPEWQKFINLLTSDKKRIAWKAYMGAYPKCKSEKAAISAAARLLKTVGISTIIQQFDTKAFEKLDITRDRINLEKARLAFFDVRKLFHSTGELKKIHELDDDTAAAIEGFEVEIKPGKKGNDGIVSLAAKIKSAKKGPILDQLSKQLGLYEADNEQRKDGLGESTAEQLLAAIIKRRKADG